MAKPLPTPTGRSKMTKPTKITDEMVELACSAYWWEDSPKHVTWRDLVAKGDHRLPRWRLKMRAALEALEGHLND